MRPLRFVQVTAHKWNGCKCLSCGQTRDEAHDWSEGYEKCVRCGAQLRELTLGSGVAMKLVLIPRASSWAALRRRNIDVGMKPCIR